MKYRNIIYLTLIAMFFAACSDYPVPENVSPDMDFDEPEEYISTYALQDSIDAGWQVKTIEEFQAMNDTSVPFEIRKKYLLRGVISADDESGNLYKKVYIQDETAGIEIAIDQVNLYNIMPRGQEVIIEMKNMWIGKYRDAYQIGDSTTHPKYGFQMSRYDWTKEHVHKHFYNVGKPSLSNVPSPKVVKSAGEVLSTDYGKLVTLENVTLPEADGFNITWSEKEQNINRKIQFADSTFIVARTSGYSNFYPDILPQGRGSLTGIITIYGTTVQFYLRDREDIGKFEYVEH